VVEHPPQQAPRLAPLVAGQRLAVRELEQGRAADLACRAVTGPRSMM